MLTKLIYVLGLLITLINTDADSLTTAQANLQADLQVGVLEARADFMESFTNDYDIEVNLAWLNDTQFVCLMSETIDDITIYGVAFYEVEFDEYGEATSENDVSFYVYNNRILWDYDDCEEIYYDILIER